MNRKVKEVDEWQMLVPEASLVIDGVTYKVPPTLSVNNSFFMPTLAGLDTFRKVNQHYKPQGYRLTWSEQIEQKMFGIRIWRVA